MCLPDSTQRSVALDLSLNLLSPLLGRDLQSNLRERHSEILAL